MHNRSKHLKEALEAALNSDRPRRGAESTEFRGNRKELRQAMLDNLADTGAETKNHTHSRDRVVIDPAVHNLLNLADNIQREREIESQQGHGGPLTMGPAGDSGSLNSSFKYLER